MQEIGAVEDAPDDLVFDLLTATAWPDQAIGRPILGTREAVGAFDRAAIDRYLRRHYSAPARRGRRRWCGRARRDRRRVPVAALGRAASRDRARLQSPAVYRGGETKLRKRLEQTHIVVGVRGPSVRRAGSRRRPGLRRRGGRRDVLAPFPGGARETRPGLFDLLLSLGLFGHRACSAFTPARPTATRRRWWPPRSIAWLRPRMVFAKAEIRRAKAQMKVSLVTALE